MFTEEDGISTDNEDRKEKMLQFTQLLKNSRKNQHF